MAPDARIVLIVGNSDEALRSTLESALRADRFRVLCANQGEAGLEYLRLGLKPALGVVDLTGPRMTSEEFIAAARGLPGAAGVPLVVASTLVHEVLRARTAQEGPMRMDELLQALQTCCEIGSV